METRNMIGRYAILKPLKSTSYATVYLATDTVLNRTVRLNIYNPALIKKKSLRIGLFQALQKGADLVHPHIAWIWDLGEEEGSVYAAERFVDGISLDQFLKLNQRMTWDEAYPVFRQSAQALEFAHTHHVLHGDLSPGNLVMSPDFGAILLNFGLFEALNPNSECTRYSDQSNLAHLLITMLSGHLDIPDEPVLDDYWPLNAPYLVSVALKRALGLDPKGPYASMEEFSSAVTELANRPQPPLSSEQLKRLEADEARWKEAQEKARQDAEEAVRQEALETARREIDEQLQRAMRESTSQEEADGSTNEGKPSENFPSDDQVKVTQIETQAARQEMVEPSLQKPVDVNSASQSEGLPDISSTEVMVKKPKRPSVLIIVGFIILILVIAAIVWAFISGYWNTIFPL